MLRARTTLAALIVVAVLVSLMSGCGCGTRKTLLTVNGDNIREKDFYSRLEMVPVPSGQQQPKPAGRYLIERMIQEKLVLQLAEKEGVSPTDKQITDRIDRMRKAGNRDVKNDENTKTTLRLQQAYINLVTKGVKVSDAEVKQAYDAALKAKAPAVVRPDQRFVSLIGCSTKDKADQAYKLLKTGTDFSTVAMQFSEDAGSSASGGKKGWIARNVEPASQMVADKAFNIALHQYTEPFEVKQNNQSAWLIVKVDQVRKARTLAYNDLKDTIREQIAIARGYQNREFFEKLQKFAKDADIAIKMERYKDVEKTIKTEAKKALEKLHEQAATGGAE